MFIFPHFCSSARCNGVWILKFIQLHSISFTSLLRLSLAADHSSKHAVLKHPQSLFFPLFDYIKWNLQIPQRHDNYLNDIFRGNVFCGYRLYVAY
jgi:hypothetical protein